MIFRKKSKKPGDLTDEELEKLGPKLIKGLGLDPQKVDKLAKLLAEADIPREEKEMWADLVFQMAPEDLDDVIANLEERNQITKRQDERLQKDLGELNDETEAKIKQVLDKRDQKIGDYMDKKINKLKK